MIKLLAAVIGFFIVAMLAIMAVPLTFIFADGWAAK